MKLRIVPLALVIILMLALAVIAWQRPTLLAQLFGQADRVISENGEAIGNWDSVLAIASTVISGVLGIWALILVRQSAKPDDALLALCDAALLSVVESAADLLRQRTFRQHALLQEHARHRLDQPLGDRPGEMDAALARHAQIYVDVADAAAEAGDYRPIEADYAQIEAVLRRAWRALDPTDAAAQPAVGDGLRLPADAAFAHLNSLAFNCENGYWDYRGLYTERLYWLPRAADAARRADNLRDAGAHLGNLGIAYRNLGQAERAIDHYKQVLAIAREIGDRRSEGNTLGNLGNAYADLGQGECAIDSYEQQLEITREIGDRRGEGSALGNLGNAYVDLGQIERAIDSYEQQLEITREIGDRQGEALGSWNLGMAYEAQGATARRRC